MEAEEEAEVGYTRGGSVKPASSFLIGAAVSGAPGADLVPSILTKIKASRDGKQLHRGTRMA